MVRFGIVGTGGIASRFARALHMAHGVSAAGISSRDEARGEQFMHANGVERLYSGLDAMLASPDVDVVYVATPHAAHYDCCMAALRAGKHVLCEKPMCISPEQAQALFDEADRRGLFLMEGMWSRFLPNTRLARRWIEDGRIGRVKLIDGMFSFQAEQHPKPRLVLPELAGGAMFDLGVYTIEMASFFALEDPVEWTGCMQPYCDGADALSALVLRYAGGALATLRMGIACQAPPMMTIYGERGRIELPRFFAGAGAKLYQGDELVENHSLDCELPQGFVYQIEAVRDAVVSGKRFCDAMPPRTTVVTARVMREMMHRFFPEHY